MSYKEKYLKRSIKIYVLYMFDIWIFLGIEFICSKICQHFLIVPTFLNCSYGAALCIVSVPALQHYSTCSFANLIVQSP